MIKYRFILTTFSGSNFAKGSSHLVASNYISQKSNTINL